MSGFTSVNDPDHDGKLMPMSSRSITLDGVATYKGVHQNSGLTMVKESKAVPKPKFISIFIQPVDQNTYVNAILYVIDDGSDLQTLDVSATIDVDQFNDLWEIAKEQGGGRVKFDVSVLLPSNDANGMNGTWDLDLFGNSVNPLGATSFHYMLSRDRGV